MVKVKNRKGLKSSVRNQDTSKVEAKHTGHISIVARGIGDAGERFSKLKIQGDQGTRSLLVRETKLKDYAQQLETLGAGIVSEAAFRELQNRIQANGLTEPTIKVATKVGVHGGFMVLPGMKKPKGAGLVHAFRGRALWVGRALFGAPFLLFFSPPVFCGRA